MKTVLQIMDYAAPYKGNFISSIIKLDEHISKQGWNTIYLLPKNAYNTEWASDLRRQHKKLYFIDNSFFSKKIKLKNILFVREIIKKEKVRLIHTHFIFYNYSLFLLKIIISKKVKFIGHFHNHFIPANSKSSKVKIFIAKQVYNKIIGVSPSVAESVKNTGINSHKVAYVKNAIDFNRLNIFESLNFQENKIQRTILMFGWPFHRKGVDIAIDAINKIRIAGHDVILLISLSGEMELVQNHIIKHYGSLPDWIKFLFARNDVATYYNAADIFLSSGREEGLNYSVLEAAYCNSMLIISNINGNPQDIPHTFKFDNENSVQLSGAIIDIINLSEEEKVKYKQSQREYVQKKYDLNNWCAEVFKEYCQIS
jgi:glycosyltransferase involved in cell wall biosynthesis